MYVNLMQFFQSHAGWTPSVGHLRFWHFYQTFRLEKGKCELKRVTFTRLSDYKSESESFFCCKFGHFWEFLGHLQPHSIETPSPLFIFEFFGKVQPFCKFGHYLVHFQSHININRLLESTCLFHPILIFLTFVPILPH